MKNGYHSREGCSLGDRGLTANRAERSDLMNYFG